MGLKRKSGNPVHTTDIQTSTTLAEEGTASTAFTDLTTVGPSAVLTVGSSGRLLVLLTSGLRNSIVGKYALMGFTLSGANTLSADDSRSLYFLSAIANQQVAATRAVLLTGLNPGATTITAKYRASDAGTATFGNRQLVAIPV